MSSHFRQFFDEVWPSTSETVSSINDYLARRVLVRRNTKNPQLAGTAFDYFAHHLLQPRDYWGATRAGWGLGIVEKEVRGGARALQDVRNYIEERLALKSDNELAKVCYVLARFDAFFRSGRPEAGYRVFARSATPQAVVDDLADDVDATREVAAMGDLFRRRFLPGCDGLAITQNPRVLLGGASETDLLRGWTLIDFKASSSSRPFERAHIRQLVGYALADVEDRHGIRELGIYFARHGEFISFRPQQPIPMLRERYISYLRTTAPGVLMLADKIRRTRRGI